MLKQGTTKDESDGTRDNRKDNNRDGSVIHMHLSAVRLFQ